MRERGWKRHAEQVAGLGEQSVVEPVEAPGPVRLGDAQEHRDRLWRRRRARARHSRMGPASSRASRGSPRQGSSSGTSAPTIQSPPRAMKRVSRKPSRRARMAAQLAGAVRPTAVIMPQPRMVSGGRDHASCASRRRGADQGVERRVVLLAQLARPPPAARLAADEALRRARTRCACSGMLARQVSSRRRSVRLDQDRVEHRPALLAAAVLAEEHDRHVVRAAAGSWCGPQASG